jgi:predicted AAA+ superfamily ATPase
MIVKRDLLDTIKPFIKRREYLAITGPRQAGKTVLLSLIIEYLKKELGVAADEIKSITFEDRKILAQFSASPAELVESYIASGVKYLFVDEFQYAKQGGQKLKLIYDTFKDFKIIITGSSSLEIKAQTGKYMVGRLLSFCLYPFTFAEFLSGRDKRLHAVYEKKHAAVRDFIFAAKRFRPDKGADIFADDFLRLYEEYLVWGGYPAVALEKNHEIQKKLLNDINNNYLLKDIKGLLELATEDKLVKLAELLSAQAGGIVNYSALSVSSGLDFRNLKKHVNILEETFICSEVKPYFVNKLKELTKNPKVYFVDNGFRNSMIDDMRPVNKRQDAGALAENAVFDRLKEMCGGDKQLNYWRTKAGAEMDFVIRIEGEEVPIEVKYSDFDSEKLTRSYMNFVEAFSPERGIMLTKNYWGKTKIKGCDIMYIPVYYL